MDALSVIFIGGVYLAACAIKFIKEPGSLTEIMESTVKNPAISVIAAILPLILGLIILGVFLPSYAVSHADLLVTVLGAFLVVNGLFRLWAVKTWHAMIKRMKKRKLVHVPMVLLLIVGIVLMLIGAGTIPLS
ncbi:MAG: hypothetical protein CMF52_01810 [Legionellales bacterium]|nr:hypothetical protein [Legionellales bacterium]